MNRRFLWLTKRSSVKCIWDCLLIKFRFQTMDFRSHASSAWSPLLQRKESQSFFLDIFSSANLLNGRCNHSFFSLQMTRFVAGLTILGSESGGQEGSWRETQASDPCISSSDTRDLCIIQDGTSICCIFYMSPHYSHNSRNFLKFFLRIIECCLHWRNIW